MSTRRRILRFAIVRDELRSPVISNLVLFNISSRWLLAMKYYRKEYYLVKCCKVPGSDSAL